MVEEKLRREKRKHRAVKVIDWTVYVGSFAYLLEFVSPGTNRNIAWVSIMLIGVISEVALHVHHSNRVREIKGGDA